MKLVYNREYFDETGFLSFVSVLRRYAIDKKEIIACRHRHIHFNIITSGTPVINIGDESHVLCPGDMVFLPKELPHTVEFQKEYSQIAVELSDRGDEKWDEFFPVSLPEKFEIRHISGVSEESYTEMKELILYQDLLEKRQIQNLAERYLLLFLAARKDEDKGFREQLKAILISGDPCFMSLESISSDLHYSKTHTERLMRENFGCGVSEYLRKIRMSKAYDLLHEPDFSIAEIAELTGFYDAAHFSSFFKKKTGISPREYRKSQKIL